MRGYFDGASRGNPGDAGAGAFLINDNNDVVWEVSRYLGRKTNNEAEYSALLLLLKAAGECGARKLDIYGDSRLVVCQVSRQWKINLPHLRSLANEAWKLMDGIDVRLNWIPREQNKRADALSNEAIDNKS